jgi:hypothetical protein
MSYTYKEIMTMKLAMLSNPLFIPTVEKLLKSQGLKVKTAFNLKKLAKRVEAEMQSYEEVKKGIFDQFGEKDETGTLKPREDGRVYLDETLKDQWVVALQNLQDIDADVGSVSLADLDGVSNLTVEDLVVLDGIVVE